MSNIEKIRQEIERRMKFHDDAMKACIGLNDVALTHSTGWIEDKVLLDFIDSLQQEPIEKDEEIEKLIVCDIMEATVKRVNIDKQDKDKEEEAMLEKINYLRNLGLNE